jgi:hypothetical protein
LSWGNLDIKIISFLVNWFDWNRSGLSVSYLEFSCYR